MTLSTGLLFALWYYVLQGLSANLPHVRLSNLLGLVHPNASCLLTKALKKSCSGSLNRARSQYTRVVKASKNKPRQLNPHLFSPAYVEEEKENASINKMKRFRCALQLSASDKIATTGGEITPRHPWFSFVRPFALTVRRTKKDVLKRP